VTLARVCVLVCVRVRVCVCVYARAREHADFISRDKKRSQERAQGKTLLIVLLAALINIARCILLVDQNKVFYRTREMK